MTVIELDRWDDAVRTGLLEVGAMMGLEITLGAVSAEELHGMGGSYISLAGPDLALQIGIVSTSAGCRSIAASLLSLELDMAAELSDADVADGVGEFVNVMAGVLKTQVQDTNAGMRLGLPMFIVGDVHSGNHVSMRRIDWRLGDHSCSAVLYFHECSAKPESAEHRDRATHPRRCA